MKQFNFRSKLKYIIILLLAAVLLGNRGFRSLVRNYLEYRRLNAEKAMLERQRVDLERQLKEVGEKPAIEQAARTELGLIRPEETEYRFPPPKDSDK
ncbi:MAG: septum formation initiator family protein [Elusimicrobiales bacterium]|nr:septum formation initiator family protein [Elusimicrobiales bacterium]